MTGRPAALDGCTIVEIDLDEAGQYAARLLAALGARVVKLEAMAGDASRLLAPFATDQQGARRSITYEFLNAGKLSLAVDLDDDFAWELVPRLLRTGGAVLVSSRLAGRLPAGLEAPVVVNSAGGLSASGEVPSTSFTRYHAGGTGYLAPTARPVMPGGVTGDAMAGVGLAVTVLGTLVMRDRDEAMAADAVHADHAQIAHAANLEKMFTGRVAKQGVHLTREAHRFPFGGAQRCADGHVSMLINEKHQWQGFVDVIGHPEWADDPRFKGGAGRRDMRDVIEPALDAWCADRPVAEVLRAMRAHHVPIGQVRDVHDIAGDDLMRQRGFLKPADTRFGTATTLGLPFGQHDLWRQPALGDAPALGQHSRAILQTLGDSDEMIELYERLALVRLAA